MARNEGSGGRSKGAPLVQPVGGGVFVAGQDSRGGVGMELGLRDRVAAVAAASQGMGRAIAREMSAEGARVSICARRGEPLRAAARAIQAETQGEVLPVVGDVAREPDATRFIAETARHFGRLDILVVNAGGPPTGTFDALADAAWDAAYALTLKSAVHLIRAAVPHMRARTWGRVIALTSISVKQPLDNLVLSNAFRMAVVGLVKTLARELAPDGILVNAISPGYVGTDRMADVLEAGAKATGRSIDAVRKEQIRDVPLGRFGEPSEIAALAAFLASERASYITGAIVQVDGGLYRGVY